MPEGLEENISCRPELNPSASLVSVDNVKKKVNPVLEYFLSYLFNLLLSRRMLRKAI